MIGIDGDQHDDSEWQEAPRLPPEERRRRLIDILEENLLHTGQISIIREAIDGLVGNGAP